MLTFSWVSEIEVFMASLGRAYHAFSNFLGESPGRSPAFIAVNYSLGAKRGNALLHPLNLAPRKMKRGGRLVNRHTIGQHRGIAP
jgi:hypothetical protein